MAKTERVHHRVRDKGGPLGGKEFEIEAPSFDFEEFIKKPNAALFVQKAYYAAVKKIGTDVEAKRNGSVPADLQSYEMIIARSLKFTKSEITEWLESRDWSRLQSSKDPEGLKQSMFRWLPSLATRSNFLGPEPSRLVALKVVAELASKPDPVADYMFAILTVPRPSSTDELLEL